LRGERCRVLASSAADLEDITGSMLQEGSEHGPNRRSVAIKRRGVEPPIGLRRRANLAIFDHVLGHGCDRALSADQC
jgi:hypothetical protein